MRALAAFACLLALAIVPPAAGQASEEGPCVARQDATDPAGDVTGRLPAEPPNGIAAMDLLAVSMWRTDEGLAMSGTLAADPREDADAVYYYWISFEAETPAGGGNPATWTFQRTSTYDRISTMYWEERSEFPVTWDGAGTFSFLVPWQDFEEQYGNDWPMDIGSPSLTSSGPFYLNDEPTGYGNYAAGLVGWNDWAEYDRELVPLPDCPSLAPPTGEDEPSAAATGGPSTAAPAAPSQNGPADPSEDGGAERDGAEASGGDAKGAPGVGVTVTLLVVASALLVRRFQR